MTNAFEPGDPVLELAVLGNGTPTTVLEDDDQPWIRKAEQSKIDEVRTCQSTIFPIRKISRVVSYFLGVYIFFLVPRLAIHTGLYVDGAILTQNIRVDCQWYIQRTLSSHHW